MNFISLIQQHYATLTKSEKKVADYILSAGEKIIYSTMSDIKNNTKVGDATIIRFCQKLGFSGFSDLKIAIAKEDFTKKRELPAENNYYDEISSNLTDVLRSTNKLIDPEKLTETIRLITDAKQIILFGVGSSGLTCSDLEAMFLRVGVQAKAVVDPHFQAQTAALLTKEDLVIAFSLSGKTKDTFDSIAIAKQNKAKIVAVTNYLLSPIARLADVVLQTPIEEFLNGASLAGKLSQLYLCDVLVQGYELKNNINSIELREKVLRSILDKSLD